MIKKIFLASTALGLMGLNILALSGCSPQESDSTPPDHIINLQKSQGKYRFGVTDTITVDFSEKIDTAGLLLEFNPAGGIDHAFQGASRLLVFGKNKAYATGFFNINYPFSMSLQGLKDLHGNGTPAITDEFQPYTWLDRDFTDSKYDGTDTLIASDSTWVGGAPTTDTLITEGHLDFKKTVGSPDYQDYKIIRLTAPDTLEATLTTRKDLDVELQAAGPFVPAQFDTALANFNLDSCFVSKQTGTTGSASIVFNADLVTHKRKLGSFEAPGTYFLRLSIPKDKEGFYRLQVRVRKFK